MKKFATMAISVALIGAMVAGGSLAYLTSEDSDVNVMTLGNVDIEQHEYQRVVNADGTYKTDNIDDRTSYVLEAFEQGKPLLPIVGDPNEPGDSPAYAGYDTIPVRLSQVDSYGGMDVFAGKNAQDKFVIVENTGRTDAYVRTLVAIEVGSANPSLIGTSYHMAWTANNIGKIEIDGNNYFVKEYLYDGAQLSDGTWRHKGGVLPAKDTSYPNLSQVYIKHNATNEDMVAIDGNGNGTLDIIVLSQAVQAQGFDKAADAFDAAFPYGENNINVAEWFGGVSIPAWFGETDITWYDDSTTEFVLNSAEQVAGLAELVNAGNSFGGKTIKLNADIDLTGSEWTPIGQTGGYYAKKYFQGNFDGQGHTITGLTIENTNDGGNYAAGFFGFLDCGQSGTIKNVTFDKAYVKGHHWVGVAAGYLSGNMENVKVTNSTVICTHANDDACGDKAGAVVGYINGTQGLMKDCSAENCTVTAGRDAGQVVGAAKTSQVTDCEATNVTVTAAGDCTGANINNAVVGRSL